MTTNNHNPPSVPVQSSQQAMGSLDHELWSHGHLGIDPAGAYPAMNYVDTLPPTRYTNGMGYDVATGPAEQSGNQSQRQLDGHRTPGNTQFIPVAPGPTQFEHYAPAIPEAPNHQPPTHVHPHHNMAGPSRGNPNFVHSEMSVDEEIKNLAGHYLHNPGSRVDKLRMRRSRSGAVKVLILLEIDDSM